MSLETLASQWGRSAMTWTGWDGSVWTLTDPASGLFVAKEGVRGLAMPPVQRYTSEPPAIAGSRYRGSRVQERECFWPIILFSDEGSVEWAERDRAFWKTMHPEKIGTWAFIQPDGTTRYLDCRFSDDGEHAFEHDPHFFGWSPYGVTLVAEQPFWRGQRIQRVYGESPEIPFFTSTAGEIVRISPGSTITGGEINNPGDVDGQMVWTLKGSFDTAVVGITGATIEVPYAQTADRQLVIDTRPDHLTAYEYALTDTNLTGAYIDRTDDLGVADFGFIPPGESVDLSLNVVNPGVATRVVADLDPLYFRAW